MAATAGAIRAGRAFVELFADDSKLQAVLKRAQVLLASFSDFVRSVGLRMTAMGGLLSLPFLKSAESAAKFEQAMANVRSVTKLTDSDFKGLSQTARALGQSTVFTSTQVAEAMKIIGQTGFKSRKEIEGLIGPVLDLASASGTELAESTRITLGILKSQNMVFGDMRKSVDVLVEAFTSANIKDIRQLGDAFKYIGPIVAEQKQPLTAVAAALQALHDAGIQGEQAGTNLRGALAALEAPSEQARKVLAALGLTSAKLTKDGHMRALPELVAAFQDSLKNLSSAQQADLLGRIFDTQQLQGFRRLLQVGAVELSKMQKHLDDATGRAEELRKVRFDTLLGQFEILLGAIDELKISLGTHLIPSLKSAVQWITKAFEVSSEWIDRNRDAVIEMAKGSAAVAAVGVGLMSVATTGSLAAFAMRGIGYAIHGALTPTRLLSSSLGLTLSLLRGSERLGLKFARTLAMPVVGGRGSRRSGSRGFAPDIANIMAAALPDRFLPAKKTGPGTTAKLMAMLGLSAIRSKKRPKAKPSVIEQDFVGLDFDQLERRMMTWPQRISRAMGRATGAIGRGFMGSHRGAMGMLGGLSSGSLAGLSGFLGRVGQGLPRLTSQLASLGSASGLLGEITMPITSAGASIFRFGSSAISAVPGVQSLGRSIYGLVSAAKTMAGTKAFAGMATGGASVFQFARSGIGRMASTAGASMLGPANLFRFATGRSTMRLRPGSLGRSGMGNSQTNLLGRTTAIGASALMASLGLLSRGTVLVARAMPALGGSARIMAAGFRQAHQVTMTLSGMAFERLRPALAGIAKGFSAATGAAGRLLFPLTKLIAVGGFQALIGSVGLLLNPMALMVGAGIAVVANWERIKSAISGVATSAPGMLSRAWTAIKADAGPVFEGIKNSAVTAFGGISAALQAGDIPAAMEILWVALKGIWNQGTAYLSLKWLDLKVAAVDAFYGIQQVGSTAMLGLADILDAVLFDWFGIRLNDVTGAFSTAWDWIFESVGSTAGWIQEKWASAFGNLGDSAGNVSDFIWNSFEWVRKKLAQILLMAAKAASIASKVGTLGFGGFDFDMGGAMEQLDQQFAQRNKDRTNFKANFAEDAAVKSRRLAHEERLRILEEKRLANTRDGRAENEQLQAALDRQITDERAKLNLVVAQTNALRQQRKPKDDLKEQPDAAPVANAIPKGPQMPGGLNPMQQNAWRRQQFFAQLRQQAGDKKQAVDDKRKREREQRKAARIKRDAGGLLPNREPMLGERGLGGALFFEEDEGPIQQAQREADVLADPANENQIAFGKMMRGLFGIGHGAKPRAKTAAQLKAEKLQQEMHAALRRGEVAPFRRNRGAEGRPVQLPAIDMGGVQADLKGRVPNMAGLQAEAAGIGGRAGVTVQIDQDRVVAAVGGLGTKLDEMTFAIERLKGTFGV